MDSGLHVILTIKEFVEATKFKLSDVLPFDLIWGTFQRNAPIYITDDILALFGYGGLKYDQKKSLNSLIKGQKISVIRLKNIEYKAFLEEPATIGYVEKYGPYPPLDTSNGKANMMHILITFDNLDLLMMSCATANGRRLREYFRDMKQLLVNYLNYQCEFYKRIAQIEVKEIYDMPHNREYNTLRKLQELEDRLFKRYRVGLIYFIYESDTPDTVKIGYTYNLRRRLCEFQIANIKDLLVKNYYYTQFPRDEEARLHEKYKDTHIRGEWYRLPPRDTL